MTEKKFFLPGIILGVAAWLIGFFCFPVESLAIAIVSLVLNLRKKSTHRIKIGMILTILAIVESIAFLAFTLYLDAQGFVSTDYWLNQLLFR
ncbi:MAG: hypothetical protein IJN57_12345 [Oscillospiraceae bacterium]|nr:hypothetical protein [Oscillospiraceae bacterium]